MRRKINSTAVVSTFLLCILLIASAQALSISVGKETPEVSTQNSWYWKPSYPNYAPMGMPDFDAKQGQWKIITAGPNGIIDSIVEGDDIFNEEENLIAPGPNCYLDSIPAGDDIEEWAFFGPAAVANCFWWFDSKYADPSGFPGDGNDQFALVQDYGAGDDHAAANVPLLIEKLARAMNTTNKGITSLDDIHMAVDTWFNTMGLSEKFTAKTYNLPTFNFIAEQIQQSQNVILLLGHYDYIIGPKVIDQQQPVIQAYMNDQLQTMTWSDYQSFTPSVNRLDAIQIHLISTGQPCEVEINVYDMMQSTTPIGTSVQNPGMLAAPTWVQFHFSPDLVLIPGNVYYFDVRLTVTGIHYSWFYANFNVMPGDPYPAGNGWMDTNPVDYFGLPFDWCFKTEYYNPPPHSERIRQNYVTCAGVNSVDFKIALSDPAMDIANTTSNDHNDAANVSHDIYTISIGSPQPDITCEWWLPDYDAGYNYTAIEQALVICPIPDTTPPVIEIIKPKNALYFLNREILITSVTLIIGLIDVEVSASDEDSGIDRVEFYVDNQPKATVTTVPYRWSWDEPGFFYYTIKVIAYDKEGNNAFKEVNVWKFF